MEKPSLNYQTYGLETDRIIFILHGFLGSLKNWRSFAEHWGKRRQTVSLDLRNHGDSFCSDTLDYASMAKDLQDFLEPIKNKKIQLIGHSMGGKVCMAYLLKYFPENVEKTIILDIAPISYNVHSQSLGKLLDAMLALPINEKYSRGELTEILTEKVKKKNLANFLLTNLKRDQEGFQWRIPLQILQKALPEITKFPKFSGTYTGEIFFLGGANSDYLETEGKQAALTFFPKACFASLPNAGHWLHTESPKEFLELVDRELFIE